MRLITVAVVVVLLTATLPSSPAPAQEQAPSNVHFVIDVSGSMSGTPLIEAKEALTTAIGSLPATTAVGLRSYAGSCGDGGLLQVPIGIENRDELASAIDALAAGGGTPTDAALIAGVSDLPDVGSRTLVLISDGASGCGDPCAVAHDLVASEGVAFEVHTVGFSAGGSNQAEMACIAEATGGEYFEADDAEELVEAIGEVTTSCSDDIHFVGARGSGQSTGLGSQVGTLESSLKAHPDTAGLNISTYALDYPAVPVVDLFVNKDHFFSSAELGGDDLVSHIEQYVVECPDALVVVAGYSQGALATRIGLPALSPAVSDSVAAVILLADPARDHDSPYVQFGTAPLSGDGAFTLTGATLPHNVTTAGVTRSFCNADDPVCSPSQKVAALLGGAAFTGPAGPRLFKAVVERAMSIHTTSYFADIPTATQQIVNRVNIELGN